MPNYGPSLFQASLKSPQAFQSFLFSFSDLLLQPVDVAVVGVIIAVVVVIIVVAVVAVVVVITVVAVVVVANAVVVMVATIVVVVVCAIILLIVLPSSLSSPSWSSTSLSSIQSPSS